MRPQTDSRLSSSRPTLTLDAVVRFFEPGAAFEPLPKPGPADWLSVHAERGQSYGEFVGSRPNLPSERRRAIYLQPFGEFRPGESPSLDRLRQFARLFFGLPVVVLSPFELAEQPIRRRANPDTRREQMLAGDVLDVLRQRLPADAYCMLGISMLDLYPDPSWSFVFGQASLRERIGVFSFARYDPRFYGDSWDEPAPRLMFVRSAKVLAHEIGHVFGIHHCVFFRCVMNGSNHLKESDARPLHLCPVDLRKLYWSVRFDPEQRYRALAEFWRESGESQEADWLEQRLVR